MPGDTVWLLGGDYAGPFVSHVEGAPCKPVVFRAAAESAVAIVDDRAHAASGTLAIRGAHTRWEGFTVKNVNPDRTATDAHDFRPMGVDVLAPHTQLINLVVHDAGHGVGLWADAPDSEIYGTLIFACGSQNTEAFITHGHGIYTQNDTGTKRIANNIIVNNYGFGIHGYPSPGALVGYTIEDNVVAESGIASGQAARYNNLLISSYGEYPLDDVTIRRNVLYHTAGVAPKGKFFDANVCLGCADPTKNGSVVLEENVIAGGDPAVRMVGFASASVHRNRAAGQGRLIWLSQTEPLPERAWDENRYFGSPFAFTQFVAEGAVTYAGGFAGWQEAGFDKAGAYAAENEPWISVIPNAYTPGRGTLIVLAAPADTVEVDLSPVLVAGDPFEIRNAQSPFSAPILTGTYDGTKVPVPLVGHEAQAPLGGAPLPVSTRDFGVFLVNRL